MKYQNNVKYFCMIRDLFEHMSVEIVGKFNKWDRYMISIPNSNIRKIFNRSGMDYYEFENLIQDIAQQLFEKGKYYLNIVLTRDSRGILTDIGLYKEMPERIEVTKMKQNSNNKEYVLENVKKGELELIDIVKIYAYFSYFSSKKLIPYESETIKKIFEDSMDLVAQKSEYYEIKKDEFTEFALVQNQKDMQKILNKFYEINESLKEKAFGKKAEEIFKCIPMKMEQFYDRFDKECMEIPIFRYYEPRNVLQRLMYSSNEDLVTIKDKMIKRAELYSELLLEEKDNLIKLREVIREYIKDKTASIKIVMLKEFSNSLGYIIKKVEQA